VSAVVDGVVRDLCQPYADGTARLEIHVPMSRAEGLPLRTGERVPVRLLVGQAEYEAGLRSTPTNKYAWVCADLAGPGGEATNLGQVLPAAGFGANDAVQLLVDGTSLAVRRGYVAMAFVTYENYRNPHVTIHAAGCGQIAKKGGQHKYGQGGYRDHATYREASEHAQRTGLRVILCSYCKPATDGGGLQAGISGRLPEEVVETPTLIEGAVRQVTVNAYERNPEARRRCIEAHGTSCCICGFSFGTVYGEVAEGYIHVHHLRPLSEVSGAYVVDPVTDLRPVCPNCHAVLHLGGECRSIEEVRHLVERNRAEPAAAPNTGRT
jgi:hypothetical protein